MTLSPVRGCSHRSRLSHDFPCSATVDCTPSSRREDDKFSGLFVGVQPSIRKTPANQTLNGPPTGCTPAAKQAGPHYNWCTLVHWRLPNTQRTRRIYVCVKYCRKSQTRHEPYVRVYRLAYDMREAYITPQSSKLFTEAA